MKYKLVKNLGLILIVILVFINTVDAGVISKFRVFETKHGVFGVSGSSGKLFDFFYKRDGVEFREFNSLDKKVTFMSLSKNQKWIILGVLYSRKTQSRVYAFFSGKEVNRNASSIDFCNAKDFSSQFLAKTEEISKILSTYEEKNFGNYFDEKSCSSIEDKGKVVNQIKQSIEKTNDDFKRCLHTNTAVAKKIESDPDFRRIMFTYFVNLYDFYKGFTDEKKVFRISCEDDSGIARINPGQKPFAIAISRDLISDLDDSESRQVFKSRFSGLLIHELSHVFNKIPSVPSVEKCEHEYQDFVSTECKSGIAQDFEDQKKKSKVPICIPPELSPAVAPKDEERCPTCTALADQTSKANSRGTGATPQQGLGVTPSSSAPGKEISSIGERVEEASAAPTGASGQQGPQLRQQLSGSEESAVRRTADSLFGPAQSGNSDIETYANQIFANSNTVKQQQAAEQIAARLDTQLDGFSKSAAALQGALGNTAVAATLPAAAASLNPTVSRNIAATGSGGGIQTASTSSGTWTPQQALNAYISGNPGPAQVDTSVVAKTNVAGKISNSGGVSAMAAVGPSTQTATVTATGVSTNSGGAVSTKMGTRPIVSSTGSVQAKVETPAVQAPQMNYELDGKTSDVRDTATLRMLSSSATNISGNLYKAITKDYKSKTFVRGLKERHILIRVVDPKTGKVQTTYGLQAGPEGQARQPSSIGSGPESKKISQPEIIFEDNGTSLRKKDN